MKGLVRLGVAVILAIGSLLVLLLAAALFYLAWRKRRVADTEMGEYGGAHPEKLLHSFLGGSKAYADGARLFHISGSGDGFRPEPPDPELGCADKEMIPKALGGETIEEEMMRLYNLGGPPRLLFTIEEETEEDLKMVEWEERKCRGSRRSKSWSDGVAAIDHYAARFLRPPVEGLGGRRGGGSFNPWLESSTEVAIERLRSSPPPKLKFLRDAEEKLLVRLMQEVERTRVNAQSPHPPPRPPAVAEEDLMGSFVRLLAWKNRGPAHQPQRRGQSVSSPSPDQKNNPNKLRISCIPVDEQDPRGS